MSLYLKDCKYLIEIITILRIMRKLDIEMNELLMEDNERIRIIKLLNKEYEENVEEEDKSIISECLSYFFDNSIYNINKINL